MATSKKPVLEGGPGRMHDPHIRLMSGEQSIEFVLTDLTDDVEINPWVKVEKYLFGEVTDMRGTHKANVHIKLDDSGKVLRIGTDQDYLHDQEENRLYRKVLVRVEADQHFKTGELRNLRLLSFENYKPRYDEDALKRFTEAGSKAWADVPDAAGWVRELRGAS